jgi:hypothetical protein
MTARPAIAAIFILAAGLAAPVAAQPAPALLSAENPDSILNVARGWGSANLETDAEGDPIIRGRIDGLNYSIFFYNCSKNKNCTSLRFSSAFEIKPALELVNQWNQKRRFAVALTDKDGDATLGLDVETAGGISRKALDSVFDRWSNLLGEYAKFTGFRK